MTGETNLTSWELTGGAEDVTGLREKLNLGQESIASSFKIRDRRRDDIDVRRL